MNESDKLISSSNSEQLKSSGNSNVSWWLKFALGSAAVMGGAIAAAYLLPVGVVAVGIHVTIGAGGAGALLGLGSAYSENKKAKVELSDREKIKFIVTQTLAEHKQDGNAQIVDAKEDKPRVSKVEMLVEKSSSTLEGIQKKFDACSVEQKEERAHLARLIKDQDEVIKEMRAYISRDGLFPAVSDTSSSGAHDRPQPRRRVQFG